MNFQIPKNYNSSNILEPHIDISERKFYTLKQFEELKIGGNSEPKVLSEREEHKNKSIFQQVLAYLNTIKPGEDNQELTTQINAYFNENKHKGLSGENISEIYKLVKKD